MNPSVGKALFSPVLSTVLENRRESLILVGAGVFHLGLNLIGLPGWVCPIRAATGIPCPGCGLTTAAVQLLHGDIAGSLHTHAFAPIFLAFGLLLLTALILPTELLQRFSALLARFETRTGVIAWILLALFLYWGARLPGSL